MDSGRRRSLIARRAGLAAVLAAAACASPASGPRGGGPPGPGSGPGVDDSAAVDTAADGGGPWAWGPVVACPTPLPAPAWAPAGAAQGLPLSPDPVGGPHGDGGGVAAVDLDQDGHLDLAFTWLEQAPVLLRADASGAFTPWGLDGLLPARSPFVADLDGDGWADLGFAPAGAWAPVVLSRPGGPILGPPLSPTAADRTFHRELEPVHGPGGALWLYAPRDGDPAAGAALADQRYAWQDGALVPLGAEPAETGARKGFDATTLDADLDGDLDVYVINDMGHVLGGDVLLRVDGSATVPVTEHLPAHSGMGGDAGDLDGDGDEDLLLASTGGSVVLISLGDGRFADASAAWQLARFPQPYNMGWGDALADLDNDGDLDALVMRGDNRDEHHDGIPHDDTVLALRNDDRRFADASGAWAFGGPGSYRSALVLDWNGDGVVDPIITPVRGQAELWLSAGCTAAGWLRVEAPVGAVVTATVGERRIVRRVRASSGLGAAVGPVVHLGLGPTDTVDALEVAPLGGAVARLEGPFPARRTVRYTP